MPILEDGWALRINTCYFIICWRTHTWKIVSILLPFPHHPLWLFKGGATGWTPDIPLAGGLPLSRPPSHALALATSGGHGHGADGADGAAAVQKSIPGALDPSMVRHVSTQGVDLRWFKDHKFKQQFANDGCGFVCVQNMEVAPKL